MWTATKWKSVRNIYNQDIKLVQLIEQVWYTAELLWNFSISIVLLLWRWITDFFLKTFLKESYKMTVKKYFRVTIKTYKK